MTQINKDVVITNIRDKQFKYICDNETGYANHLKNNRKTYEERHRIFVQILCRRCQNLQFSN